MNDNPTIFDHQPSLVVGGGGCSHNSGSRYKKSAESLGLKRTGHTLRPEHMIIPCSPSFLRRLAAAPAYKPGVAPSSLKVPFVPTTSCYLRLHRCLLVLLAFGKVAVGEPQMPAMAEQCM